uniref:Uncharacterized protein n=1 Tax=Meloidogyne floridensis TaxID=298350 RepID=A0A915NH81_9BILA
MYKLDFTASNSEQLTILSGQRVEILNNCDIGEDNNNNNNEFVKIAVLDKSGQRENEGMVPKRILMPLDGPGGTIFGREINCKE